MSYGKQGETGEEDQARSDKLKGFVREYFQVTVSLSSNLQHCTQEPERKVPEDEYRVETCEHESSVRGAIRAFVLRVVCLTVSVR